MTDPGGLHTDAVEAASGEYLRVFATHREALVAAIHVYVAAAGLAHAPLRERNAWMLLRRILAAKPEHVEQQIVRAREWLARQEVVPSDYLRGE